MRIKAYLTAIILGLLFTCASQPVLAQQIIDKIIAKVDNHILLKSELDIIIAQNSKDKLVTQEMRCGLLRRLLINKLLLAKAEIDSVTVGAKEVEDNLDRRLNFFIQQVGGRDKLEGYYKKSIEQFKSELRRDVKNQMVVEKMESSITEGVTITPAEVKRFYDEIPKDSLPYFSKEVEVGQIVVKPKVGKNQKRQAREKANAIRERLLKGEDFAKLAKEYSEDPGSAAEGGNLGYWGRGAMVPEYEATAMRLNDNDISEVVESSFGFHIIQLLDRRGNEYNSRHILIKPNASNTDETEVRALLDSLSNGIQRGLISFEKAAKDYSEDETTKSNGGYITDAQSRSSRIALENLDPTVYFTIDTLKPGRVSTAQPFRTDDGKDAFRILYYKKFYPPHEANLKEDYAKISMAALNQKKAKKLAKWFDKSRTEVYIQVDPAYQTCDLFKQESLY